MNHYISVR